MISILALVRRHRTVATGLLAQVLQYGSALALLPFIVTRLPAAEVAIWYLFITMQGLVFLADFGFQPTIGRAVASAHAGVGELRREGLGGAEQAAPNLPLIRSVVSTARWLYLAMAAAVLLVLATLGSYYVASISRGEIADVRSVEIAWGLFAIGTALNLYFLWIAPLLIGTGRVAQSFLLTIVARGGFALMGIVVLLSGGGLIALAGANLASVLLSRLVASAMLRPVLHPLRDVPARAGEARKVLSEMWPNAWRLGLVALGAFAINRSNLLVLSGLVDLPTSARYAVSLQLLTAVAAVSQLPTQAVLPQMIALRVRGDMQGLRAMFLHRQAFLVLAFIAGAGFLLLFGEPLLALVGSNVRLLSPGEFTVLALVLLLETNHSNCAVIITTGNRVPFVVPGLLSGAAVVTLAIAAASHGGGVMGVILAQGLVQAAYNNWKWPVMLWKELRQ